MPGMQKVWLRVTGKIGDTTDDTDDYPDRVMAVGRAFIKPNVDDTYREKVEGPDGYTEISLPTPVSVEIVDGMVTYMGKPFVWLDVPETGWNWNISFADIRVRGEARQIAPFNFDLEPATPTQIANAALDPSNPSYYKGVNLADLMQFTPPSTGTPTVQGPRGYTWVDVQLDGTGDNFVFTLGDPLATEFTVGPIPALTNASDSADAAAASAAAASGSAAAASASAGTAGGHASAAGASAAAADGSADAAAASAATALGYVNAFDLDVGTVTTAATGVPASATVYGGPPGWMIDLVLPKGDTGATGPPAPDATTSAKGIIQLGGDLAGTGSTAAAPRITDGSVGTSKLGADVTPAMQALIDGSTSVTSKYTKPGPGIPAADLATDAVTTVKILDGNVTLAKMATDSVDASKIVDGSITNAEINASAAVALAKMAGKGASFAFVVQGGTRAVNAFGDLLVGMYVMQPMIVDSILYQFGTADASGSSTFKCKKNTSDMLTSGQAGITAANQADGTATDAARTFVPTSNNTFAKGDRFGVETLTVGTTPGKVLIVIVEARWA